MKTTSDLAALRALVEADPAKYIAAMFAKLTEADKEAFNFCVRQARGPDAWAALERVEQEPTKFLMDTNDYTGVPKSAMVEAAEDAARLARLESALRDTLEIVRMQAPDIYEALDDSRAALEGRDE